MTTTPNNTPDNYRDNQNFDEFLCNCETLMETATSKDFDKEESFVILLAAKHLDTIACNAAFTFEMDTYLDGHDKVAKTRLNDVRDCIKCIAAIINRMQANILICGVNLN